MKNNRKILSIALSGAMVPMGLMTANERVQGQEVAQPLSSSGRIGDSPSSIGDSGNPKGRELLGPDYRPEAFRQKTVGSAVGYASEVDHSYDNRFIAASYAQDGGMTHQPMESNMGSYNSRNMYESVVGCCPQACGGGASAGGSKLPGMGWAEVDALIWWGPYSTTPPLAVEGPIGSLTPNNVVAGGEQNPLGGKLLPGVRANVGFWLDDSETIGVGGRFTTLFTDGTSENFESNGDVSLGLPFFNASTGQPDVLLVALDTGANGADSGSISVNSKTTFLEADAYGRFLLARTKAARVDLLGGYTFVRLDDSLGISSRTVDGISGGVPDGTVETFNDTFSAKNTFHGGLVGFTTDITRGAWSFSTLSKVSIGNMRQVGRVAGSGDNLQNNQGFYARNLGTQTRDVFTFLPEAGAKLRYHVTPKASLNVGYSFLFFPDIAKSSGLIDTSIDINPIGPPIAPRPRFSHDNFYLHGIDLGFTYSF